MQRVSLGALHTRILQQFVSAVSVLQSCSSTSECCPPWVLANSSALSSSASCTARCRLPATGPAWALLPYRHHVSREEAWHALFLRRWVIGEPLQGVMHGSAFMMQTHED